jgi:prefoldin subunit 5
MRTLIDRRLTELRAELDAGRQLQSELDARQAELRQSMLRISGAIQVLGELAAADDAREGATDESSIPLRRVADQ